MGDLLPLDPDELLTTTRAVRRRLDLFRPAVPVAFSMGTDFKAAARLDWRELMHWNTW